MLHNLRSRYNLDEIYTYTGSILIAVNPFQVSLSDRLLWLCALSPSTPPL